MTDKPVIARLKNGAEYGFASAELALKKHPDATIVSYQGGAPYEAATAEKSVAEPPAAPTTSPPAADAAKGDNQPDAPETASAVDVASAPIPEHDGQAGG